MKNIPMLLRWMTSAKCWVESVDDWRIGLLAEQEIRCVKVGRAYKIPKVCVIEYLMGEDMCRINLS